MNEFRQMLEDLSREEPLAFVLLIMGACVPIALLLLPLVVLIVEAA